MGQAKQRREGAVRVAAAPQRMRITADDAAYLRRVRAHAEQSGQLRQQAARLEEQADGLRSQATALFGAHESFVEHLCLKYGLDKDRDQIDPVSGAIIRPPGAAEIAPLDPGDASGDADGVARP